MEIHQLYTLLKKYRRNRCIPDELEVLEQWYAQFDKDIEKVSDIPQEKLDHLFLEVERKIGAKKSYRFLSARVLSYVAGVAAIVVLGWIGRHYLISDHVAVDRERVVLGREIMPGATRAELVCADGSKIVLDNHTIIKDKNGLLIKEEKSAILDYSSTKGEFHRNEYNTISVPLGGEFGVVLSDGSRVWLNSGSTLNFPVTFGGASREVYLTGEAYFEVTKSDVPFMVKTMDVSVKVMGTSFNMSAYHEDERIMTTLVEGKVIVHSRHDDAEYEMKPGFMLSYEKKTNLVSMEECDTDLYASWVNGEFKFRDMRLEDIMIKLNRWYNCEFFYQNTELKDLRFTGAAEKDRPVNYLLEMIEAVTKVHFEIKGKTVILQQK